MHWASLEVLTRHFTEAREFELAIVSNKLKNTKFTHKAIDLGQRRTNHFSRHLLTDAVGNWLRSAFHAKIGQQQ
jgi:hypothetical protein